MFQKFDIDDKLIPKEGRKLQCGIVDMSGTLVQ